MIEVLVVLQSPNEDFLKEADKKTWREADDEKTCKEAEKKPWKEADEDT